MIIEELKSIFSEYQIKKIDENNIDDVFELIKNNKYYLSKVQNHELTLEECIEEISALPPNKEIDSKTYIAIYNDTKCIAVIDFVEGYPNDEVAFIGLFILDISVQEKGLGTNFFERIKKVAHKKGFTELRLGCMSGNEKGFRFWTKMGFKEIYKVDRKIDDQNFTILVMNLKI